MLSKNPSNKMSHASISRTNKYAESDSDDNWSSFKNEF
jgi:hypothetical protein